MIQILFTLCVLFLGVYVTSKKHVEDAKRELICWLDRNFEVQDTIVSLGLLSTLLLLCIIVYSVTVHSVQIFTSILLNSF